MDQYLNFASLEEDFFSLLLPKCFHKFNDPATHDTEVESTVDSIVNGLFSAVVTLGSVPILRYKADGGPSQMVAEQLGRRLHDQLKAHPALFSDGQSGFQRPLLVVMERSADLSVMVQHAWSYCALCHDLLDLKLNRVTIQEANDAGGPPSTKTYDLHAGDTFWARHIGSAFPTVAEDVDRDLGEYRAKMESINSGNRLDATGDAALADSTRTLASTINQLPELQMKKALIDAHMNIATELLGKIRERSIDSYYALEEAIMEGRSLSREDKATLPTLMEGSGVPEDRLRLLLVLYLHPGIVPEPEVAAFEATLEAAGANMRALAFLKKMSAWRDMQSGVRERGGAASGASTTGGRVLSRMMQVADQVGVGSQLQSVGSALANGVRNGVRQLLVSRRETPMTRAVTALVENKGGAEDDGFAYLDPKLAPTAGAGGASRSRTPYSQAMVFVVGPGNYLEYQNLRQAVGGQTSTASSTGGRKACARHCCIFTRAPLSRIRADLGRSEHVHR